jgi:hypothetical protein
MLLTLINTLLEPDLGLLEHVLGTFKSIVSLDHGEEGMIPAHRLGLFYQSKLSVTILKGLLALARRLT